MSRATLTGGATPQADPVLLEIIAGSLASIEQEVETAIGRTARSPMVRDAHDFRAGIHDRLLRKLTGRSYSSLVHPIVRDFPIEHDACRATCTSTTTSTPPRAASATCPISASPCRSSTTDHVVAFVQAFGHHDDIGGAVPGSMPSKATSVFEEGLMVPPIKLRDARAAPTRPSSRS